MSSSRATSPLGPLLVACELFATVPVALCVFVVCFASVTDASSYHDWLIAGIKRLAGTSVVAAAWWALLELTNRKSVASMFSLPHRGGVLWIARILGSLVLLSGLLGVANCVFPGRAFDSAAWHDEARVEEGVRLGMADHLVADGALLGKHREHIVELLGEPPRTDYFSDWDMVYWLGAERDLIFSIDSEWLVLKLSRNDRVVENRIVRD